MPYSYEHPPQIGERIRVCERHPDGGYDWPAIGCEGTVTAVTNDGEVYVDFSENPGCPSFGLGDNWWVYPNRIEPAVVLPFYLVEIVGGQVRPVANTRTFATGKEAQEHANILSARLGHKVQPRRIAGDSDAQEWRERERTRLTDGTYPPMPAGWDLEPIADHFLHLAVGDPKMVSFTETPEKGVLDRQTRMAPGRYLERFYPHLTDRKRKAYISLVDKPDELHITRAARTIYRVYRNGPHSCMAHPPKHYNSFIHPVRVYAGSDLALAWIERDGRITGRAIVRPATKTYGRAYGDEARMRQALEAAGYSHAKDFAGAKIPKVWDAKAEKYVMPYIDYDHSADDPNPDSREGYFVLRADYDGIMIVRDQWGHAFVKRRCPKLGTYHHPASFYRMQGTDEEWSDVALAEHAQHVYNRDTGEFEWWPHDQVVQVWDYGRVPKPWADEHCFKSDIDGQLYHREERLELWDGRVISQREFRYRGFQCRGSRKNYLDSVERTSIYGYAYAVPWLREQADKLGITKQDVIERLRRGEPLERAAA